MDVIYSMGCKSKPIWNYSKTKQKKCSDRRKPTDRKAERDSLLVQLGWCTTGVKEVRTDWDTLTDILKLCARDWQALVVFSSSSHLWFVSLLCERAAEGGEGDQQMSTYYQAAFYILCRAATCEMLSVTFLAALSSLLGYFGKHLQHLRDPKYQKWIYIVNWFLPIGKQIARRLVVYLLRMLLVQAFYQN